MSLEDLYLKEEVFSHLASTICLPPLDHDSFSSMNS